MQLVYTKTQKPVQVGDLVKTERGDRIKVLSFSEPHKPSFEGKVHIQGEGWNREFYVSVIGAEWINREDRQ